jgi:hypothetical protein
VRHETVRQPGAPRALCLCQPPETCINGYYQKKKWDQFLFLYSSVVDPDPNGGRVGSALFCRIWIRFRIEIQGLAIWIPANEKVDNFNLFSENFTILSKILNILTLRRKAVRIEL